MDKLKDFWNKTVIFVSTKEFITGVVVGFALGALHHFYGL